MALYLGSKRVCPSIQVEVLSMKAFFDAGGKCGSSTTASFDGLIKYSDTSNVTNMDFMFQNCTGLTTTIPQIDTSKVTSMINMFYGCFGLKDIPQLNVSNVTNMSGIFTTCYLLTNVRMYGMKADLDIHYSTRYTRESLVEILNNLATVTTTKTLTMGSTNLAKLTDEDKAIATNKGWTLA